MLGEDEIDNLEAAIARVRKSRSSPWEWSRRRKSSGVRDGQPGQFFNRVAVIERPSVPRQEVSRATRRCLADGRQQPVHR